MGLHVGTRAWRQVPMAIGLQSLELENVASCEPPNVGAENPTPFLWESSKRANCCATSHANNTILLLMVLITIQSGEFPYSIFTHSFCPSLLTSSLPPNLCPLPAEPPPSLLLSCYKYSIASFSLPLLPVCSDPSFPLSSCVPYVHPHSHTSNLKPRIYMKENV